MKFRRQSIFISIALIVVLLCGCTSSPLPPPAIPTLAPTSEPQPDCSAGSAPDFSNYATWTKVNPRPLQGHEVYVNIYVDDLAKKTYLSASGETFPVCAIIVKTHLESETSENITAVTIMVKMPAGYDPENNDWWWGMYDEDGRVAEMSGKVPVCIACHKPAAAADYVFSQKVISEIGK